MELFKEGTQQKADTPLPGMGERELLESMSPEQIVDLILADGERVTEIEKRMNQASEVLEGAYGLTVDEILGQREERQKNGEQK